MRRYAPPLAAGIGVIALGLASTVLAAGPAREPAAFDPGTYAALHGITASARPATTGQAEPVSTTPLAPCGPGSFPEATQGRAPLADYSNGRAAKGYLCNTRQIGHYGDSGGFHVFRYVDRAGHVCAFYDSTLLFPKDVYRNLDSGAFVLDMTHPAQPVRTAVLRTLAMQSPHESLRFNAKRGLLIATTGSAQTLVGTMDIYDVRKDCRTPQLRSTLPLNLVGHEGGFSPDGMTYWATVTAGPGITAIDVSNPDLPSVIWSSLKWSVHGLELSADGNRAYLADVATAALTLLRGGGGLTILDVSQIQSRQFRPAVKQLGHLTWPEVSIPQNNIPIRVHGREITIEFDEYDSSTLNYSPTSTVGGVHIIDTQDPAKPRLISRIRLQAWDLKSRQVNQQDPGANRVGQGYAAHYCSVPTLVNPTILACSMIASGLRIFDIRDPLHPREVAYFNKPSLSSPDPTIKGSYAMSAPAFDVARHQIWYVDANTGFYVVSITNGAWPR